MSEDVPHNALFVCFGGMSNVGILSGLASLEAIRQLPPGKAGIFCLGGLPTQAPIVLRKTQAVERIITIDGCPLNCAKKIVENAGFVPAHSITLTEDCDIQKGPPSNWSPSEMEQVSQVIQDAVLAESAR
jgi:uncharacterized metal-binding protein